MIAAESLAGVNVFFPDPWHKTRHHKRRLLQPPFARLVASRLAPGGLLHCATDWQPYAEQMLEVLGGRAVAREPAAGFAPRPAYRPVTKFEHRGLPAATGLGPRVREGTGAQPSRPSPTRYEPVGGGEHQDAEGDAVPGERHEGVRGDVAEQPAHADPGREEREDESDGEQRQVGHREQRPLLQQAVGAGADKRRDRQEEAEVGRRRRDRPSSMPPMMVAPERLVPGHHREALEQADASSASRGRIASTPRRGRPRCAARPRGSRAAEDEGGGDHRRREQVRLDHLAEHQAEHDRRHEARSRR